ncbi:jg9601 [Pararge aegeria aegeria]|uniref:Jg9601 protein n=1 Tax=Pararge aegeria aegeria TaxID=348720 RepID=A0A8S4S5F8_9NEOP|nr:jg9601 [Pararge aegeria aegeria]
MVYFFLILALVASFELGSPLTLETAVQKSLKWPEEYYFKGEEVDYLAGIITPFEMWYSGNSSRSRIDYNDGTVKNYYVVEDDGDIAREFKVHPQTTEEETNVIVCTELFDNKTLYDILPEELNYEYIGPKFYNGKFVDVWEYAEKDEIAKEKTEKTLYVYQEDGGISIPVYEEIKVYNLWIGAVSQHSVKRFYDYSKPVLEYLDLDESCNDTEAVGSVMVESFSSDILSDIDGAFRSYVSRHNKKYRGDEHEIRKQILQDNLRRVIDHNQKNLGYKLTINKFSDRTDSELANIMGALPSLDHVGSVPFPHTEEEVENLAEKLPKSFDMRLRGYISSVKNQAECGSCWSFATIAAVEGALARKNVGQRNLDLSEQSLVDCSWGFNTYGCDGGMIDGTFEYILEHGIPSEMEYGLYLNKEGWCSIENMTELHKIKDFAAVPPLSVNAMKLALYEYGPVTVTINANDAVFSYDSGIFYDQTCNNEPLNHAVTVVGYGVRDGVDYWIVKNSWGEDYGEDGYILISARNNTCHILENAFYPVV